ncbi:flagellar biosynthesis protein FlhB [Yunchengibacter salinarum]|uniref:flagellar biosynthesis protein FlhB n=1 Tax=Yunchengibacter salinarum TaxID=3133399 RepID=UPI0035B5E7FD
MADDEEKTEEPTSKKLDDAKEKGDMAVSQEVKTWVMLIVVTFLMAIAAPWFAGSLRDILSVYMEQIHGISQGTTGIMPPIIGLISEVGVLMAVPFSVLMLAGFLGSRVQNPVVFTNEKLKPKLSNMSPAKGLKKIFGTQSLIELLKTLLKFAAVGFTVLLIVWPERDRLDTLVMVPIEETVEVIFIMVVRVLIGVTLVVTIVAAIDIAYQKHSYHEKMKMTKQEVKDERKQQEGSPEVKKKLAQIRAERGQQRMMASVPNADVVVTNPTHFAVALEYKHGTMDVPKVIAKGTEEVALRIRETAEEHGIPVLENPPLARALFASVDLDEEVPPEHYKAVAEVIGYVMRMNKAAGGRRRAAG